MVFMLYNVICSKLFYFFLLSLVINVVTLLSDVTDVTVWPITSNSNPRVLKIEKYKIIEMKMKNKLKSIISFSYKEALKSHSWKQEKASTSSSTMAPQNEANLSPVVSPTLKK